MIKDYWDWNSPITLATDQPISQPILCRLFGNIMTKLRQNVPFSLLIGEASRLPTIYESFVVLTQHNSACDVVFYRKSSIIIAVRRNTHYCAASIVCTYVRSNKDWQLLSG